MSLTRTELQNLRSLLTKKGRKENRRFSAEGVRLLEEAFRHHFRPECVFYSESLLSDSGQSLVGSFRTARIEVRELPARQLESLTDTETTQGIVGVFPIPEQGAGELYRSKNRRVLLCENIGDPGNLGTLIRSALAFGFDLVVAVGTTAEAYSPKVVRSTAGALFGIAVARAEWAEVKKMIEARSMALIAATVSGRDDIERMKKLAARGPVMLAIGSETHGLSAEAQTLAVLRVRIRHAAAVESLNAAVAGSILMSELSEAK